MMTKSDLRVGDICTFRDGLVAELYDIRGIFYGFRSSKRNRSQAKMNSDMTNDGFVGSDMDIIKVVRKTEEVLFERERIPEYTMEEVLELVGHKFTLKQ